MTFFISLGYTFWFEQFIEVFCLVARTEKRKHPKKRAKIIEEKKNLDLRPMMKSPAPQKANSIVFIILLWHICTQINIIRISLGSVITLLSIVKLYM